MLFLRTQDIADVTAYRERGLDYTALCQPHWVHTDAATFYGFWGACFNDYRNASPHEGYATVRVRAYTAQRPLAASLPASLTGAKYGGVYRCCDGGRSGFRPTARRRRW